MKTIITFFFILLLCLESLAQISVVGARRHFADKGVPPIANISELDIPDINNNPDMVVIAKEVRTTRYGSNALVGIVNTISTGYNSNTGKYYIKYEDSNITMQPGTAFNILYAPRDNGTSQNGNFTHKATSSTIFNAVPWATVMDYSLTNGDDSWNFVTTKYFGNDEVINLVPVNLYPNLFGSGEWTFTCDTSFSIPVNSEYNLIGATTDIFRYDHISTFENIDKIEMSVDDYAYFTILDDPFINNNPDALVFAEPIVPTGSSFLEFYQEYSVYYNATTGLWELHMDLAAFPGSGTDFPTGITFQIFALNETSLGISEAEVAKSLKFYPNPANDIFNIESKKLISEVIIFNLLGQKIEVIQANDVQNLQINMSKFSPGNYFAKVKIDDKLEVIRFLKN